MTRITPNVATNLSRTYAFKYDARGPVQQWSVCQVCVPRNPTAVRRAPVRKSNFDVIRRYDIRELCQLCKLRAFALFHRLCLRAEKHERTCIRARNEEET